MKRIVLGWSLGVFACDAQPPAPADAESPSPPAAAMPAEQPDARAQDTTVPAAEAQRRPAPSKTEARAQARAEARQAQLAKQRAIMPPNDPPGDPPREVELEVPESIDVIEASPCPVSVRDYPVVRHSPHRAQLHEDGIFRYEHKVGSAVGIESCSGERWDLEKGGKNAVWTAGPSGSIYSAQIRVLAAGNGELVVSKIEAQGVSWQSTQPVGRAGAKIDVVRASPKGVFIVGNAVGQLPGSPPEVRGQPWVARFDDAGGLEWIEQLRSDFRHRGAPLSVQSAAADEHDNLYLIRDAHSTRVMVTKVGADGEPVWSVSQWGHACRPWSDIRADAAGKAVYYLGMACLGKLSEDGSIEWSKTIEPSHDVVVDEVEGTRWKGGWAFNSQPTFTVGDDEVFYARSYGNHFELGSAPAPSFDSTLVVHLDGDGELRSVRHLRAGPLATLPGETGSNTSFTPFHIAVLPSRELRLVGKRTSKGIYGNTDAAIVTLTLSASSDSSDSPDSPKSPKSPDSPDRPGRSWLDRFTTP